MKESQKTCVGLGQEYGFGSQHDCTVCGDC
jgi:hypothetical protein